jgi:hypothetical protein
MLINEYAAETHLWRLSAVVLERAEAYPVALDLAEKYPLAPDRTEECLVPADPAE